MRKAFLCLLLLVLMTPFAHADYFTVNYNLRVPEVGSRDWNEKISKDIVSIDNLLAMTSNDSAWTEDGTYTYLQRNPSRVCIGKTEPTVSLDVQGSIKAHAPDGDYVLISGDGSHVYTKWSDGVYYLQTEEGTPNGNSLVYIDGKGTGYSAFSIIDGDGGDYLLVTVDGDKASFTSYNLNEIVFNDDGGVVGFRVQSDLNQNAIQVSKGNSCIGINKGLPVVTMDVVGHIAATGWLSTSGDIIVGYQSTGNIGVGKLPTVSLDVAGNIQASGTMTADMVSIDSQLSISAEITGTVGGQVGRIQIMSMDGMKCYIPVYAGS